MLILALLGFGFGFGSGGAEKRFFALEIYEGLIVRWIELEGEMTGQY